MPCVGFLSSGVLDLLLAPSPHGPFQGGTLAALATLGGVCLT